MYTDNPAAEDGVPPPLPPYPYDPQQGAPQTNYEEEDDQVLVYPSHTDTMIVL